jgi:Ca-activated chloride channel family protein
LLGQYRGEEPLECTLEGNFRGTSRTFRFRLNLDHATTRNAFVPRLWASRKIGLLIDAIREQGGNTTVVSRAVKQQTNPATRELVDEIVRLSTEFGILTEYTSFLAQEGTDLTAKDAVRGKAEEQFRERAMQTRTGLGSVNQDLNNQSLKVFACANPRNRYLDAIMCPVETTTVQQVADRAFYKRSDRWVDSRLIDQPAVTNPKRIIQFGSREFHELLERLAREGRQGTVSLHGDILMLVDGEPVLIKAPSAERVGN